MVMENLEKSWNLQMPFCRPGKIIDFSNITESFVKVIKILTGPLTN